MSTRPEPARWTAARKHIANDTSATFYGILATLSAALPLPADQLTVRETVLGAMFIGFVGLANRWFMDALKLETELGRHLTLKEAPALLRQSALALLFPVVGAGTIWVGVSYGFFAGIRLGYGLLPRCADGLCQRVLVELRSRSTNPSGPAARLDVGRIDDFDTGRQKVRRMKKLTCAAC